MIAQVPDEGVSRREALAGGLGVAAVGASGARSTSAGEGEVVATSSVKLTINGEAHDLELDTRVSLLDLLRERLRLTGAKKGCNQGACGACTVLLNGRRVNACLILAARLEGAQVLTIEGLSDGEDLHPLQSAFIEHDAFQCGYCTPGQILSGLACISEGHALDPKTCRAWMSGNICRCGAYLGIVAAITETARS